MTRSRPFRSSSGRSLALGANDPRARRDGLSDDDFGKGLDVGRDGRVRIRPAKGGAMLNPASGVTTEDLVAAFNDLQARLCAADLMER